MPARANSKRSEGAVAGLSVDRDGRVGTGFSVRKKLGFALLVVVGLVGTAETVCRFLAAGQSPGGQGYIERWEHWREGNFAQIERVSEDLWVLRSRQSNSDGMRDREHLVAKPAGVVRIACLGDSVTIGFGVSPAESYPFSLEVLLTASGRRVEVFNVGMMGWTVRQYRAAYRRIIRKYRVDEVLLGICLNDIPEMQNNLAASRLFAWLGFLHRHSALVRVVMGARAREIGSVHELFSGPDLPRVVNAWKLFEGELAELFEEIGRDGVGLTVVAFPFRFQVLADAPDPIPQYRLAEFCGSKGIRYFDVLESLRKAGPRSFHDYDHLSALGGQVVAEAIVRSGVLEADRSTD